MRRVALLAGLSLLLWACTGGAPTTTVAPSTAPPASTTSAASTTTFPVPVLPEILVSNDDGVFLIGSSGEVTQLVTGRVAYAVDDTRGGLLFQVERGRSLDSTDSRVWWVPRGSGEATELLVPTPGLPLDLSLCDAFSDRDGNVRVLYVRHDSTWDPEVGPFRFVDCLRTLTIGTGEIVELVSWSGYEAGLGMASGSADVVAVTIFGQIDSMCGFLDPTNGEGLSIPGAPVAEPNCEADCPSGCVVSDRWLAYKQTLSEGSQVVAVSMEGLDPTRTFEFDRSVGSLDVAGTWLLVNHGSEFRRFGDGAATVIDLRSSTSWSLSISGIARFVTAPVDIDRPVIPPTPAAIQLRADGLGVVSFGAPVEEVIAVLTILLGPPDWEEIQISTDRDLSVRWGEDGEELLYGSSPTGTTSMLPPNRRDRCPKGLCSTTT